MPLPSGTRFGGYETLSALGAGGPPSLNATSGRGFGEPAGTIVGA
jgi:hypothetical protein